MIVTLTPNPAIDVTYRLPALFPGESHRVDEVQRRAGGKGVNTAGVLARGGVPHAAVAPVSVDVATWWETDLSSRKIRSEAVETAAGWTMRTSTAVVADDGAVTVLNEAGAPVQEPVWCALAERSRVLLRAASEAPRRGDFGRSVLAVCGSLPGACADLPPAILTDLVADAVEDGHAVVVDGSGEWLRRVLPLRPDLVKPNAAEARATTGETDPLAAARSLVAAGARAALVSRGADGAVLVTSDGIGRTRAWTVRPARALRGNPTGAGDAATAAVSVHLSTYAGAYEDSEALLRRVSAWSGAAVLHPLAGDMDPAVVPGLSEGCRVDPL